LDRIQTHVYGGGGSAEKQREKEWWEGNRRERDNGENLVRGKDRRMI